MSAIDIQAGRTQLQASTGRNVPDNVAAGILGQLCATNPAVANAVRVAAKGGEIVRVRPDVLYSTVGVLFTAAGAAPAVLPALFARPIGDTEPTLGAAGTVLNSAHTNMRDQGRIDSRKKYVISRLGFDVFLFDAGTGGATTDALVGAQYHYAKSISATLFSGTQTQQELGPILWRPLPGIVQSAPLGSLAAGVQAPLQAGPAPSQGMQAVQRLERAIEFGAGESLRVELDEAVAGIATDAAQADMCVAVRCCMYGISITQVTG